MQGTAGEEAVGGEMAELPTEEEKAEVVAADIGSVRTSEMQMVEEEGLEGIEIEDREGEEQRGACRGVRMDVYTLDMIIARVARFKVEMKIR